MKITERQVSLVLHMLLSKGTTICSAVPRVFLSILVYLPRLGLNESIGECTVRQTV